MDRTYDIARRLRGWGFPLGVAALVAYFAYFAVYGSNGILASRALAAETRIAEAELEKLRAVRTLYERRIRSMRAASSLDLDLLDELARAKLGLIAPGEVVIREKTP